MRKTKKTKAFELFRRSKGELNQGLDLLEEGLARVTNATLEQENALLLIEPDGKTPEGKGREGCSLKPSNSRKKPQTA